MEHGLATQIIVVFTLTLIVWAAFSARLESWSVTPAIVFVLSGIVVGSFPGAVGEIDPASEMVRTLAEIALAVVLFTDAARVDVMRLRREAGAPMRLLLIGLPLTVALGCAIALVTFDIDPWLCALIAASVAPTDAALGAPLMADERIPIAVRQLLNVESGINDGLITPIVTFFLAGAVAEVGGAHHMTVGGAITDLALGVAVGGAIGGAAGVVMRLARQHGLCTSPAESLAVLAIALLAYAGALGVGGNGFVGAFVGGLAYGAVRRVTPLVLEFSSEAGELLASAVWFAFGAVALSALDHGPWTVFVFAVLALTAARMVPVALASIGSGLTAPTVAFVGWFGPRGLASVVFALIAYDELSAGDGRATVLAAVTATVLMSVVAHGLTARPLAARYASNIHASARRVEHRPVAKPWPKRLLGQRMSSQTPT